MGFVSQKLRDSARGQECTLRLPGICQGGTETTVLCHLRSDIGMKAMGMKVPDYWAVFACQACHDQLDGRSGNSRQMFGPFFVFAALQRTWAIWFETGLLDVPGQRESKPRPISKIVERKPSWQLTPIGGLDAVGFAEDSE